MHHIWLVVLIGSTRISAQPIISQKFGAEMGLISSKISALVQDSSGHLWLGTDLGLCRFNGYTFDNFYQHHDYVPASINALAVDQNNRIWIGSTSGLSLFDQGKFSSLHVDGLDTTSIQEILTTPEHIFIFTLHSMHILDEYDRGLFRSQSMKLINPWCAVAQDSDVVHIGHYRGLMKWDGNSLDTLLQGDSQDWVVADLFFEDSVLFFGTEQGHIYSFTSRQTLKPLLQTQSYGDFRGFLSWQSRRHILFSSSLLSWENQKAGEYFSDNQISGINCGLVDDYDNLWLGSENGLFCLRKSKFNKKIDLGHEIEMSGLGENLLSEIWIGGPGKIMELKDAGVGETNFPMFFGGEIVDQVYVHQGERWIASNWRGLLHQKGPDLDLYSSEDISYLGPDILDLHLDAQQRLWLGTTRGLFVREGEHFLSFDQKGISSQCDVYKIQEYENRLWLASSCGLFVLMDNDVKQIDLPDLSYHPQLRGLSISDDKIWIGTVGRGLRGYQIDHSKLEPLFALAEPYPSILDVVSNKDEVWAGSPDGLIRILTASDQYFYDIYTVANGFPAQGLNHLRLLLKQDGELRLAAGSGVYEINRFDDQDAFASPDIVMNEILVNGAQINQSEGNLYLPSHTQTIEFGFYYPDLVESDLVEYSWQMQQHDVWSDWSQSRRITLYAPKHGHYDLRIRARKSQETLAESHLSFVIRTPFFQRPLIIATASSLALGMAFLYLQKQKRSAESKQRIENQRALTMATLEAKALRSQMNPHFLFNILNNLQEMIVSGDNDQAQKYLNQFARLMRMILNISSKEYVRIEREIDFLALYLTLENLRFDDTIKHSIEVHPDLLSLDIPVFMVQPLVENALKHGLLPAKHSRELIIRFKQNNPYLMISVIDNGVGMTTATERKETSDDVRAVELIQNRLKILSQKSGLECKLQLIENESNGITAQLFLPLNPQ